MARMRSISSIEAEITKVEAELAKAQEKYDSLAARLQELHQLKKDYEARQVVDAFHKSGKTFQELMTFLEV